MSAKGVARSHGLDAHGTLWLLARAHRAGKLTAGGAGNIVDVPRDTGMRLPCDGSGFDRWARRTGLL
ncbi:hypothetical protein UO65_3213 [Actinokineospora spheciospongiae]|uniref:Uncharacterized protein n=1 Tax=Actinokineospora spheciospongiae TaxID=909613 RepID=W7IKS6_9PSEU|nr:hypothetical protein [Actinokineospora spheciospongiae]EWC61475.1 hypothetical protein UO65_3213 [Actinokineospora spheciospongiae]PWW64659.1 hypothetical protein DFQ13_103633 [Actinokineospora spheciospongiae]